MRVFLKTYYVYTLSYPKTDNVFYVGVSTRPKTRIHGHFTKFGYYPDMAIIDEMEGVNTSAIRSLEGYWICQFRSWGFRLLNKQLAKPRQIPACRINGDNKLNTENS